MIVGGGKGGGQGSRNAGDPNEVIEKWIYVKKIKKIKKKNKKN